MHSKSNQKNHMTTPLTQILKQHCHVTDSDILDALKVQEEKGGDIGSILKMKKVISEKQLLEAIGLQYDIPFWSEAAPGGHWQGFCPAGTEPFSEKASDRTPGEKTAGILRTPYQASCRTSWTVMRIQAVTASLSPPTIPTIFSPWTI